MAAIGLLLIFGLFGLLVLVISPLWLFYCSRRQKCGRFNLFFGVLQFLILPFTSMGAALIFGLREVGLLERILLYLPYVTVAFFYIRIGVRVRRALASRTDGSPDSNLGGD